MDYKKLKGHFKITHKKIWIILLLLLVWFIIPTVKSIEDNFYVYNYSDNTQEIRNLDFKITITKYRKLFSTNDYKILLEIDDRTYRYNSIELKGNNDSWIPLKGGPAGFYFGVLLPNYDFSEFVLIFDEKKHHYDESDELEFITYPKTNEEESRQLLEELIEYNNYYD